MITYLDLHFCLANVPLYSLPRESDILLSETPAEGWMKRIIENNNQIYLTPCLITSSISVVFFLLLSVDTLVLIVTTRGGGW
mmetsp:Transcript_27319/g.58492  ORF Transcript_27319/g.58492 Transcript_27319/m.58492 type:complete len:82 (+) Transcript_27319:115-360(+)